ncbi:uncharacterized protein TNCV_1664821 [Trichonephila clavipes]|uniref:Uncharacterized protein n=1 Tax=Trichonephila clavipes TaxID=2585209 RepID=A0A8X6VA39_TRICX|nr:uncharacterized protein TNCV_1664821 [Trichonephila clavipes]
MTPCDFFLWGFIKDKVFIKPLPRDLVELRKRIRNEFAAITRDMLVRVWTEMEHRLNICGVTKVAILNLCKVQLCDEAHFWLNDYVNKQNCRISSEANPQVYVETPLHPEKLTVWCALWAGGILLQKR